MKILVKIRVLIKLFIVNGLRRAYENFRIGNLNSEYFSVFCRRLTDLKKGDQVYWKYSKILEPWIEVYNIDKVHIGTLPIEVFKREFSANFV